MTDKKSCAEESDDGSQSMKQLDGSTSGNLEVGERSVVALISTIWRFLVSETEHSTTESTVQYTRPISDCGSVASHSQEDLNRNLLHSGIVSNPVPKIYCSEYPVTQINGCRQYGPPKSWSGPTPGFGCEIYVKRIPPEFTEADLVPVFERFGKYENFIYLIAGLVAGLFFNCLISPGLHLGINDFRSEGNSHYNFYVISTRRERHVF